MKRILVLGDGQLGAMLAEAASRIGLVLDRLSPETELLYRGTGRSGEVLPAGFDASGYDLVTAEREHLPDTPLIARLLAHPGFGGARAIAALADRRSQKALLDRLQVPTARWCVVHGLADIEALARETGSHVIVKAARGGYDGRGQWRLDAASAAEAPAELHGQLIAERTVAFSRELSLVGARGPDGDCVFYPLVQNHHEAGMLRHTLAPARATAAQQQRAEAMLRAIMEDLGYTGVMAVELFEEHGELLVNELAPRVHNSGHWSQEGATTDQFELHLRAIAGLPLHAPRARGTTLMLNLVGCAFDPGWLAVPGVQLHWYGKERRPGRKLGHLNVQGETPVACAARLQALLPTLAADVAPGAREALALLEQGLSRGQRRALQPKGSGSPITAARRKAGRSVNLPR